MDIIYEEQVTVRRFNASVREGSVIRYKDGAMAMPAVGVVYYVSDEHTSISVESFNRSDRNNSITITTRDINTEQVVAELVEMVILPVPTEVVDMLENMIDYLEQDDSY